MWIGGGEKSARALGPEHQEGNTTGGRTRKGERWEPAWSHEQVLEGILSQTKACWSETSLGCIASLFAVNQPRFC